MNNRTKWSIDPAHSEIAFKVKHFMIAHVKGVFKTFDASIYTEGNNFVTSEIDLWINAASISTGDTKRDTHLKSADFFDVENHKQINFSSHTIGESDNNENHELWGDLTMKGITKKIALKVQFGGIINDPWGNERAGFTVTGTINRRDWKVDPHSPPEKGNIMVGEEVKISCEVELINTGKKISAAETDLVIEEERDLG